MVRDKGKDRLMVSAPRTSSKQWNIAVGEAIDAAGSDGFAGKILDLTRLVLKIDTAAAHIYTTGQAPSVMFDRLQPAERKLFYEDYLSGLYLVSPFYQAFLAGVQAGVYSLDALAPDRFRQSEYYRKYFRHIGASDLAGVLVPLDSEASLFFSVARRAGEPRFTKSDLKKLSNAGPVLIALFKLHCRHLTSNGANGPASGHNLHNQYNAIFEHFGSSMLTAREAEVIRLVLRGFSTKSIARDLTVSPETIRVHRKHAYNKLNVKTQGDLFNLFLQTLLGRNTS
jgi:DNA-binding CsgD family transcriptional regulator